MQQYPTQPGSLSRVVLLCLGMLCLDLPYTNSLYIQVLMCNLNDSHLASQKVEEGFHHDFVRYLSPKAIARSKMHLEALLVAGRCV